MKKSNMKEKTIYLVWTAKSIPLGLKQKSSQKPVYIGQRCDYFYIKQMLRSPLITWSSQLRYLEKFNFWSLGVNRSIVQS